jgi:hypothetical protein
MPNIVANSARSTIGDRMDTAWNVTICDSESRDFFDLSFCSLLFYTPNVHDTMLELTTTAVNIKSTQILRTTLFLSFATTGGNPDAVYTLIELLINGIHSLRILLAIAVAFTHQASGID